MVRCANCSAELQPTWKFCIYCGTRVTAGVTLDHAAALPPPASSPRVQDPSTDSLLAAIRAGAAPEEPRTITVLALFGWALGGLLGVLALVAAVLLLTS